MTDVLKIALERRAELHEELTKLDDFIRMAEVLIRSSQRRSAELDDDLEQAMPKRPVRVGEPIVRTHIRRAESSEDQASEPLTSARPQVIRRVSGE